MVFYHIEKRPPCRGSFNEAFQQAAENSLPQPDLTFRALNARSYIARFITLLKLFVDAPELAVERYRVFEHSLRSVSLRLEYRPKRRLLGPTGVTLVEVQHPPAQLFASIDIERNHLLRAVAQYTAIFECFHRNAPLRVFHDLIRK